MMDKVQKHNSFNTNTPSSESYKRGFFSLASLPDWGQTSLLSHRYQRFCLQGKVGHDMELNTDTRKMLPFTFNFHVNVGTVPSNRQ
jgi:hypothetical protein